MSSPATLRTETWALDSRREAAQSRFAAAGAMLVFSAVVFNAGLAFVNANVAGMSPSIVIACEIAIVSLALLLAVINYRAEMAPWFGLLMAMVFIAAVRGFITEAPDIKYLRDVLIIPVFVLLGLASRGYLLERTFVAIHAIIFGVFLIEIIFPETYSDLFRIQDYYLNTRGNDVSEFYDTSSDLFISATRPGERFLPFIDAPRSSSVFLEPVSLGNYCSIAVAYVCAAGRQLGFKAVAFALLSTALMLIGSDGRLAVLTCVAIIGVSSVSGHLPQGAAVLILPAALAAAAGISLFAGPNVGSDDFFGRVAHTITLLQNFDAASWLGVSNEHVVSAMDSGIAYLVTTQSIMGVTLIWIAVTAFLSSTTSTQRRFTYAFAIYVSLSLLVSYSLLTIKTAALLWFIHGALYGAGPRVAPQPQRRTL